MARKSHCSLNSGFFVILNSPLLSRNGNSRGGVIPIHAETEGVAKVAQLEVVIAADGVGGQIQRFAVQINGGVRERCGLIAGRQGGLLAADRGVGGFARQVDALLGGVPCYFKLAVQTLEGSGRGRAA